MFAFLSSVLHTPVLLSDSRVHLFLQSDLSITKIEKCALGKTRYTVAEAIQRSGGGYIGRLEDKASLDSDCERYELGQNVYALKSSFQCLMLNRPPSLFLLQQFIIGCGTKRGHPLARKPCPFL